MTDDEENDLLLQVVQAFSVCEDNRDGIAADAGVAIPIKTMKSPPVMASVCVDSRVAPSGGGIGIGQGQGLEQGQGQGNRRMPKGKQGQGLAKGPGLATVPSQQLDTEAIKRSLADAHVPGSQHTHILSIHIITHVLTLSILIIICTSQY